MTGPGRLADDFTGATDLAGNLVATGRRTVVVPDVPDEMPSGPTPRLSRSRFASPPPARR